MAFWTSWPRLSGPANSADMSPGNPNAPSEFDIIAQYLAPLSADAPGAFGLTDDAAVLRAAPGRDLVVTKDALVAGVHFLKSDPPDLVARKILRVNLSDMAAMGATPKGYFLATFWPGDISTDWIEGFACGLAADQKQFSIALNGGDTVRSANDMAFSVTMFGEIEQGRELRRSGAGIGDIVYVSGTIGDGHLGMRLLSEDVPDIDATHRRYLEQRYQLPEPRVELGQSLLPLASSCLDISDGLLADLGHISDQSAVRINVNLAQVPISAAARHVLARMDITQTALLSGGDDYELAFTVPKAKCDEVLKLAARIKLDLTPIGEVQAGKTVALRDHNGDEIRIDSGGWSHF